MRIKKITQLSGGRQLFAWWANNAGRGNDNCSLAVVPAGIERKTHAAKQTNIIASTRTGSWRGDVNLSNNVRLELEILSKSEILD